MHPFISLLIAHLLGDVVFNSHRLAVLKRAAGFLSQLLGVGLHSIIHALFACFLLLSGGHDWIKAAFLVFIMHFIIDFGRSSAEIKRFGSGKIYLKRSEFFAWVSGKSENPEKMNFRNLKPWFLINLLDQGCHIISLYIIFLIIV